MINISWREKCLSYPNIMFGRAIANARSRSSKKSIPFDLTRGDIIAMFEKQGGRCYYSDVKMNIVKSDASSTHDPFKMTLDCVDPSLGYIKDNVVWCAYCVNALKLKMSKESMIGVCRAIVKKAGLG